jgi:hypothetical protein
MSIFFPDNEKRRARLIQLTTDTSAFLCESAELYRDFQRVLGELDEHIATAYRAAGLTPPGMSEVDVLAAARVPIDDKSAVISISKIVADVGVFVGSLAFLAPGALASGAVAGEAAATGLLAIFGMGAATGLAATLVPMLIAGVVAVSIGLVIDAIEGWELRNELRHGIASMAPMRVRSHDYLLRARVVVKSMTALRDSWQALADSGSLTEQAVAKLTATAAEDLSTGLAAVPTDDLAQLDRSRQSWVDEDPPRVTNTPAPPLRLPNCYLAVTTAHDPPMVPAGLAPCRVASGYPVLCHGQFTLWPFHNGDSVTLVWFDTGGQVVRTLPQKEITTVTALTAADGAGVVHLTDGDRTTRDIPWRELAPSHAS